MTAGALLAALRTRGVVLTRDGAQLRYRAPQGALTPPLVQAIAEHKAALLQVVAAREPEGVTARALIAACYRRVGAAWHATPPAERPEAAYQALAPCDAALWAAYAARDVSAVRRAVAAYEQAAAPIFAAWRASRDPLRVWP